jgi:hydrogenase maturation protease
LRLIETAKALSVIARSPDPNNKSGRDDVAISLFVIMKCLSLQLIIQGSNHMESQKSTLILGLGNILLQDEGVGVRVAERIKAMPLPPDVEVMDGGTMGLDLVYYIEGRKKVIVIDAVRAGDIPGTMYRFTDENIAEAKGILRSAHGVDFADALRISGFLNTKPDEVVFIGIEPESLDEGLELTPLIEKHVPALIELVMREIGIGNSKS